MIGVVDYGCGNLRSLQNALDFLGLPHVLIREPSALASCRQAILPGVGHFGHAVEQLGRLGLDRALECHVGQDRPLFGICLGMQLLFEGSAESPGLNGLGLIPGIFERIDPAGLKVPHMGWNRILFEPGKIQREAYFVHSYCLPAGSAPSGGDWLGLCRYGTAFVAAFRRRHLAGCQFHPEKSGPWGLQFLREVLTWS